MTVKAHPKKVSTVAKRETAAKAAASKGTVWTFPKNTLEDAIKIAQAVEEKNAGNPMPATELAKAVGFNTPEDWRFTDLLRSANLYGLVSGSGAKATVAMEKIGQDIVAPGSPQQRQQALLDAFRKVEQFAKVQDFYKGKKIPDDEFFANTLVRDFYITRDRVEKFSEVFLKNIDFLRAFDAPLSTRHDTNGKVDGHIAEAGDKAAKTRTVSSEPKVREHLDTCFVMMPFGGYFDRYYEEIYVPAIKEAGFEPRRADELFTTGSVVEQIWEQVSKAKLLLADLTGKNANVFYELGLAHAARKPVVFVTADIADVPFDLTHLRVIRYDTREPGWDDKLKKCITDYLKNAAKDPEKSIPHPFRDHAMESALTVVVGN